MTALYIVLGILLFFVLLFLIRIQVFFEYTDDVRLMVKVLFVKIPILPPKEKPKKQKKEKKKKPKKKKPEPKPAPEAEDKKKEEKKQSYLSKLKDKKGVTGIISLFKELAKIAGGLLKGIFSRIVITKLVVGIALKSGDAASTALAYGKLCSAIYPSINIIVAATICRDYHVTIEPIFDDERETEVYAVIHAYIRIGSILWEAVKAGVKLLIARMKL